MTRIMGIGTTVAALAITTSAQAAIVSSDSFESASSAADLTTAPGTGSGWSAPWNFAGLTDSSIAVGNRNMSYSNGSVQVDGGQKALEIKPGTATGVALSRPFANQTETLYLSFLFQAPTSSNGNEFFQFGLHNSIDNPTVSGGIQRNTSDANRQTFFSRTGTGQHTFADSPIDPQAVYFVVLKISKSGTSSTYNNADLFINPTSSIESEQSSVHHSVGGTVTGVSNLIFRVARNSTDNIYYLDEFTLGSDFASVVPIPEPASLSMLVLSGFMLLNRRTRRTAA